VLGKFTRKQKANGGLDFSGADGGALVDVGEFGRFSSNSLKNVVDEGVHDGHGLVGDTSVRVDLRKIKDGALVI
jgi:hypothetical protein